MPKDDALPEWLAVAVAVAVFVVLLRTRVSGPVRRAGEPVRVQGSLSRKT
ncbi:MAG: hypothetical protein Q7W02_27240 [Candidatus Rokubacteria bacterium]|nr:hypothetical protein [Candidatus Rokubacteria bacterium]